MACAHPLTIRPKYREWTRSNVTTYSYFPNEYQVPCGYCVNCRKDYQNYVIDRANYEYCKRLTASFVTVTYDDIHLIDRCAVTDQFGFVYDYNNKGDKTIRTSINYDDITHYLNSIRTHIARHPEMQNILCQPDFAYIYCGEYGDCFGRCHAHFLFFGLDFAYCKKLFFDKWKFGFVDVLPLLDGGIRYVCKYMDKFEKGLQAELKYDFKGIARPRLRMSRGFGQSLLWDNVKDIKSHDFTYETTKHARRPISQYWKILLTGNVLSRDHTKKNVFEKTDEYIQKQKARFAYTLSQMNVGRTKDIMNDDVQSEYKLRLARVRESNIIHQLHNKGIPVPPFESLIRSKFGFVTYDNKKIRRCPKKIKRELVNLYVDHLLSQNPYKEVLYGSV